MTLLEQYRGPGKEKRNAVAFFLIFLKIIKENDFLFDAFFDRYGSLFLFCCGRDVCFSENRAIETLDEAKSYIDDIMLGITDMSVLIRYGLSDVFYIELSSLICDYKLNQQSETVLILVESEPNADGQNEYKTFSDILVDTKHLVQIRTVLNDMELLKSDGNIRVGTARNAPKQHITALYYAMDSNSLLLNNDKDIFIELLKIEFNVEISKRSLENQPNKTGKDKASEYYKGFLKKLPKVQR